MPADDEFLAVTAVITFRVSQQLSLFVFRLRFRPGPRIITAPV